VTLLEQAQTIRERAGVEVSLVHVAELRQELLEGFDLRGVTVSSDARALIADARVDIVCELIGGREPARSFILEALAAGKHVVTANKRLLAECGEELTAAAIKAGCQLRYEAAVAGAIPIIKALRESLAANRIEAIYGILNGTCNYILTRMTREGLEFDEALTQAIAKGFAETPPDLDIEGHDTAHKCQILASLACSTPVALDSIYVEGITRVTHLDVAYAGEMGYVIKLLAVIREVEGELEARVHPTLVPREHLLANVNHEFNAVHVQSTPAGATLYYGRGAGRLPTASAVVGDVVDIAVGEGRPAPPPFRHARRLKPRDAGLLRGQYYLRLTTEDHPGVLGQICTILGRHDVSIGTCIQKQEAENVPAHIVLLTHDTVESQVRSALSEIDGLEFTLEPTQLIRVMQ
jgi:homoserine dehydrogenase